MPLYDYHCRQCGHNFELLVMGNEKPSCPQCQGEGLDKRMSGFSVRGKASAGQGGSASKCSGCGGGSCASCH